MVWFSFHPWKGQIAVGVDRVDLLDISPFHAHHIPFAKAFEFVIHLILDPSLVFAGQRMILPPSSARAKRDRIEILAVIRHHLTGVVGGDAEGISIVRLSQASGFAQGDGQRLMTFARRSRKSLRALEGLQGIKGCPF